MRWDEVATAIHTAAVADATLLAIFGADAIRAAASAQDLKIPGLEYRLVADTGEEVFEPSIFQWEIWVYDYQDLVDAERALRRLFDHDLPVTIAGVHMFAVFTDGAELVDNPDRAGFRGRALRFRFSPVRECLRIGRDV